MDRTRPMPSHAVRPTEKAIWSEGGLVQAGHSDQPIWSAVARHRSGESSAITEQLGRRLPPHRNDALCWFRLMRTPKPLAPSKAASSRRTPDCLKLRILERFTLIVSRFGKLKNPHPVPLEKRGEPEKRIRPPLFQEGIQGGSVPGTRVNRWMPLVYRNPRGARMCPSSVIFRE